MPDNADTAAPFSLGDTVYFSVYGGGFKPATVIDQYQYSRIWYVKVQKPKGGKLTLPASALRSTPPTRRKVPLPVQHNDGGDGA